MKIQIKDLKPNPFRDMKNYPVDPVKVYSLIKSIKETGFWDNILARNHNGEIQIAYGHHRLVALQQVMQLTDEVDIPVKDLSDAVMIKIMAKENLEDWHADPRIINEAVMVAKRFLEEHREEKQQVAHGRADQPIGAPAIAKFLGWPERRVSYSLELLRLIDEKVINKDVFEAMPTQRAARNYANEEKRKSLQKEKKRRKFNQLLDEAGRNRSTKLNIAMGKDNKPIPTDEYIKNEKMKEFISSIHATNYVIEDLEERLESIIRQKTEFDSEFYKSKILNLSSTLNKITSLTGELFKTKMNHEGDL